MTAIEGNNVRITDGGAATFLPPDLPQDGWAWFHIDNGPSGRPIGRLRISIGVDPGELEIVSVTQAGNVGIGNPNPAQTLDVAGNVQAADFLIPSDERLKTNINQLSGSLDSLDAVRGVSFEWSETAEQAGHANGRKQIGVIAQELAAVRPELVFTPDGNEGYMAVDYSKLTALLLEAIKELRTESEAKIRALGEELGSLRKELSLLDGPAEAHPET